MNINGFMYEYEYIVYMHRPHGNRWTTTVSAAFFASLLHFHLFYSHSRSHRSCYGRSYIRLTRNNVVAASVRSCTQQHIHTHKQSIRSNILNIPTQMRPSMWIAFDNNNNINMLVVLLLFDYCIFAVMHMNYEYIFSYIIETCLHIIDHIIIVAIIIYYILLCSRNSYIYIVINILSHRCVCVWLLREQVQVSQLLHWRYRCGCCCWCYFVSYISFIYTNIIA